MRRTTAALIAALFIMLGLGAPSAQAFPNGGATPKQVAPIATGIKCEGLQGQLRNDAAAGWNTMALAAGEALPTNGCASAYRMVGQPSDWPPPVYGTQWYFRGEWCSRGACGNAAWPGSSRHGEGVCVDLPEWVRGYIDLHGARFGYSKSWSDAPHEPWHVCFNPAAFNRPDPGLSRKYPVLRQHSGGSGQNVYVRKAQKLTRGHGDKTVTVDGEFGWRFKRAIKRFQRAERIPVTGIINRRTWKRLRQPVSKPVRTTPKAVPPAPAQPAPKAPEVEKPKPSKPKNRPAWGVDTSNNNYPPGRDIDWKAVRRDGASFACLKATEGQDWLDPEFSRAEIREVTEAGLVPCAYHFLRPRHDRPGAREAAWFAQVIGQAGFGKGWMRPMLDIEVNAGDTPGAGPDLTPPQMCRYVGSFLWGFKRVYRVKPEIYATPSYIREYFSDCEWLGKYQLWIAHVGVSEPEVVHPWRNWALWQYTWEGRVAGIPSEVDVNKVRGGRKALAGLRVKKLPRRARLRPRARVELPLEAEPKRHLKRVAPTARREPAKEAH
jgi:GH25 family lysozyme M1 (1,4-beta-N-acetylmuramidase)